MAIALLFWPAILVSLSLMGWSMSEYRPRTAIAAALLGTPVLLYLWGSPRFTYIAPLALCAYYAVPVALAYRRRLIALVCATPFVALAVSVAWLVVRNR